MNNWDARDEPSLGACTLDADFDSAFRAAKKIGIPLHRVNMTKEYWSRVFQPALEAYSSGVETPNPDITCNREIKFGALMGWAKIERIDFLATGHYAQIYTNREGQMSPITLLQQSVDLGKDQTYFLSQTPQEALHSSIFPVGGLLKSEVRSIAASLGFDWLLKRPESMGICFVGPGKHRLSRALQEYLPVEQCGPLICLETGKVIGEHRGLSSLTIGQNARLASMKSRMYVAQKDKKINAIYLVDSLDHPSLNPYTIKIRYIAWHSNYLSGRVENVYVSIRSQDKLGVPVKSITPQCIELESPVFAPAAGQYAVLYKDVPGHDRRVLIGSAQIA